VGDVVFRLACMMGCEGIVSKRFGSIYRSGKCKDWLKFKNPAAPAMKREAEEDWARSGGGDPTTQRKEHYVLVDP
jgi:ATP-dependent DNA ligase